MGLLDIFTQGGPIIVPLLLISLAAVTFAVERFLAFMQYGKTLPQSTVTRVIELAKAGRASDALSLVDSRPGPTAACLGVILQNPTQSKADLTREVSLLKEAYGQRLERFLPALDTFTTLSPLLGLLGTILGMVKVFQQFSGAESQSGTEGVLNGVGESLYATAFGITIAVFCFAVYNYFAARQRNLSIETDQATTDLIGHLTNNAAPSESSQHAFRHTRTNRNLKRTKIEIIPMIDTMFFLLVFFILSSLGIIKLDSLPVTLPVTRNGDVQKQAQITISIDANRQVKVNATTLKPGELIGDVLKQEAARLTNRDPKALEKASLILSADSNVDNGFVLQIINEASKLNINKFAIATDRRNADGTVPTNNTNGATP